MPPVAASVSEYVAPTMLSESSSVVMVSVGEITVMASALVTLLLALSVTRAVKLYVPRVVGVPVTSPILLKVRLGGSEPATTLHE